MSFLSSLFGVGKASEVPAKDWAVASISASDGSSGIFRHLIAKPVSWQSLSEEISISWKYEGVMPDSQASKRMMELEEALKPLLDAEESRLTFVLTLNGIREWCFYAKDYDAFMRKLNVCLKGKALFPVKIEHSHDAAWKYWQSFMDKIVKK